MHRLEADVDILGVQVTLYNTSVFWCLFSSLIIMIDLLLLLAIVDLKLCDYSYCLL